MVFAAITAGVMAGAQFSMAKKGNAAAQDAANQEAVGLTRKAIDDRIRRAEDFNQVRGLIKVHGGMGQQVGPTSRNVSETIAEAAGAAALDVYAIKTELKDRMAGLNSKLQSEYRDPFMAAAQGAMQGYTFGKSFGDVGKGMSGMFKPKWKGVPFK